MYNPTTTEIQTTPQPMTDSHRIAYLEAVIGGLLARIAALEARP